MQRFPCPFCGLRDETEFFFGGEAGNLRPEHPDGVSPERWSDYLYMDGNPKGPASEVWVHLACGEFFRMERDTLTHEVSASHALRGADE